MSINIRAVINGYIVSEPNDDGSDVVETIFPESIEGVQEMLWHILENTYGPGSRYDAERIRIVVAPGDKYEGGNSDES